MGWLRELMAESPTAVRSLGGLARRGLAHPGWPKDRRLPQERSLAALLSKIDRGLELDWLGDRPEVQRVLADVLGTAPSRIAEAVGRGADRADAQRRRIRFTDLPLASPLELTGERLPPGIPDRVLRPHDWGRLYWVAPRGSGRSLAGAWLAARSLAAHVCARTWAEAEPRIPETGAVLVEVLEEGSHGGLAPPRSGVCIAAADDPGDGVSFDVVRSAPPDAWLDELVTWIALRLPRDGHFEPGSALPFLREAATAGFVTRLGDALGLSGLIDARGTKELARLGMARTADLFVSERLGRAANLEEEDRDWLAHRGSKVVVALAKGLLASAGSPEAPRPEAEFMALVPEEHRGGLDAEWVRRSLARATAPSTVKELERALAELPPGAFRVVRALERAGILAAEGAADALVLGPAWLATASLRRARESIVHGSPLEYAEALLSADPAWIARGVVQRVRDGDTTLLEDALDAEDGGDIATVAAFELAVRAAGLAVLEGTDLPEDLRVPLFDQALALLVPRADGPCPLVGYPGRSAAREPLLDVGVYRLALLALGESLPASRGAAHAILRPVAGAVDRAGIRLVFDSIWRVAVHTGWHEPWTVAALELAARISRELPGERGETTLLETPAALVEAAGSGTPDVAIARGVGQDVVRAALSLGARRGVADAAVLGLLWRAWETAPAPVARSPLAPDWEHGHAVFAVAPPEALRRLLEEGLLEPTGLPYEHFDRAQWEAVLDAKGGAAGKVVAALRAMPEDLLARELQRWPLTAEALAVVAARSPRRVIEAVLDAVRTGDEPRIPGLLEALPAGTTAPLVDRLRELRTEAPGSLRSPALQAWLYERVAERDDGYRDALDLLRP